MCIRDSPLPWQPWWWRVSRASIIGDNNAWSFWCARNAKVLQKVSGLDYKNFHTTSLKFFPEIHLRCDLFHNNCSVFHYFQTIMSSTAFRYFELWSHFEQILFNNVTHNFIIYPINYCTLPPLQYTFCAFDISSRLSRLPFPSYISYGLNFTIDGFHYKGKSA